MLKQKKPSWNFSSWKKKRREKNWNFLDGLEETEDEKEPAKSHKMGARQLRKLL